MRYILNIGLDNVKRRVDYRGRPTSAAEVAFDAVKALNFKTYHYTLLQSDSEPTIVVRANHNGDVAACANWLAEELGQDCIAVFDTEGDLTGLYGPRAAAWGDFNPEFFLLADGTRLSDHGTVLPA